MTSIQNTARVSSLDILRGLTMFLLVFFQPVFTSLCEALDLPWLNAIACQFEHEEWAGFRVWDMIMPLFLFMSGTSLPFSFAKYDSEDKSLLYRKIARRFIILFILGMMVQGNLFGLDPKHFSPFSNTLQAIAMGYLITSLIVLNLNLKWQVMATVLLMFVYWLPMSFCGDMTPDGNFAEKVDQMILGRFRDCVYRTEDGSWHFADYYHYTWIWSSLTFGVTVMLGYFAGLMIKTGKADRERTAVRLAATGAALIAVSLLWSLQMPIIKKIWTASMSLFAGGISFLLLSGFYYMADCKGCTRGLDWLKIYGMNSIVAYFLGEAVNFRSVVASVSYGLEKYIGDFYGVWLTFGNFLIVFLILNYMYRNRIFVKI